MPLDRFVPRFAKYELKQSQISLELVISLSLIRIKALEDENGNVQSQLDEVKAEFYAVSNRLTEFEVAKTKHGIQS